MCTFLVSLWHHILLKSSRTTSYITHLHFNSTSYQSHIKNANYTWDHTGSLVKLNVKMMSEKRSSNNNNRVLTPSSSPWYKTKPRKCSRRKLEFFLYGFFCFVHPHDVIWYFFPKSSSINHLMCLLCIYFYAFFVLFFFLYQLKNICMSSTLSFLHMM